MIICPNCKCELKPINKLLKCKNNHSFDISKEGYINLLLNKPNSGDNSTMIKARQSFLSKGYFNKIAKQIVIQIDNLKLNNPNIVDIGCADGYYTNIISKKYSNVIGIDISKDAIKLASKTHKFATFLVASAKDIPIENDSVHIILNIFAPHFIDEYLRILKDNSFLIKVTPNKNHLIELKKILYDKVYLTKEKQIVNPNLSFISEINITYIINLHNHDIKDLLTMTPYLYKTKSSDLNKLKNIANLDITLDFNLSIYQKKHSINT